MGLFDKKYCCVCGDKAGMLTRQKLADDYICGDCRNRCSPNLTWRQFESMTARDVHEHIAYMDGIEQLFRTEFRETYAINTGIMGGTRVVSVDERNGWWMSAQGGRPDIISLDQVLGARLELETRRLSPEDMRKPGRARMPMPPMGMPGCAPDEEITVMKVIVSVDHPWLTEIELKVMNAVFVSDGDIRAGYECAQRLFQLFDRQANVRPAHVSRPLPGMRAAQPAPGVRPAPVQPAPSVRPAPAQPAPSVRPGATVQPNPGVRPGAAAQPAPTARPGVAAQPGVRPGAAPASDPNEALRKFRELYEMGAITREEYEARRRQLQGR